MKTCTGPLFKWFGSKWSASRYYPAPVHDHVFEPYAGSAGYSLRHSDKNVTVYDADPNLSVLWAWLIGPATHEDVCEIPLDLDVGYDIRTLGLSAGQAMLLKHWQRTNNTGDCWVVSPWGNKPGQWTKSTRDRVAREVELVKHWKFSRVDFSVPGTYFVDPPYEFNYKYRKSVLGAFDYDELVVRLRWLPEPNQVIACEAECQKTGRVPNYLPFEKFRETVTSRRKTENNHHSKELVYHRITGHLP